MCDKLKFIASINQAPIEASLLLSTDSAYNNFFV